MAPTVHCAKLGKELEGFDKPRWPGEVGVRIQENVSKEAWGLWLEHAKMVINEYRLNLGTPEAQKIIVEQMEAFLFGDGGEAPPDYVPVAGGDEST